MKKREILLWIACMAVSLCATAQSDTSAKNTPVRPSSSPFSIQWHGMVNPVIFADTRQVVSGREGMMLFYPASPVFDEAGTDLNAVPNLNMLAITARLSATITGPDVLGAKMKGYIEGDFTGATNESINLFRLRHAYINMKWQRSELLFGQYWYPMVIHEIMPETQPLNMGAPFHPYARYNQIRYLYRIGPVALIGTAAFQLDNKSNGPFGASTQYIRSSCIPEFNLQVRYEGQHLMAGAAANLLTVRPRTYVTDTLSLRKLATNQIYTSASFSLYARYNWSQWAIKAQTLLSDNLYEGCTLGGYIETKNINSQGYYSYNYRPFTFTTVWTDFGRTTGQWRPGIFLGYAVNNDFASILTSDDAPYGRGIDIQYLYRIQPRIGYYAGHGLSFGFEIEHTFAQFGERVATGNGGEYRYSATSRMAVSNTRFILGAVYAF